MIPALLLASALLSPAQEAKPKGSPAIQCVVIERPARAHSPGCLDGSSLAVANLLVMHDGTYVSAAEQAGWNDSSLAVSVFRSSDKGSSWSGAKLTGGLAAPTLFEVAGDLYLLGTLGSSRTGWPVILRSADKGATWTKPIDETSGVLRGEAALASCAGPALNCGGRLWRAFVRKLVAPGGTRRDHAIVASAPLGGDMLNANTWRWSNELPLDGLKGNAWEGSVLVSDGEGRPSLVLRSIRKEFRGTARLSADGFGLRMSDDAPRWVECDTLGERFERDATSGLVSAIAAFPDSTHEPVPPSSLASELSLLVSRDLNAWDLRTVLLRGQRSARFTCADWAIDGKDLVAVVGGSLHEDGEDRALLFLRVPNFRERRFGDPPASAPMD